jgi:hypothetical protein
MQLRPTMANFVFAEPRNEQFKLYHKIAPLFEEFKVRNLVTNFRQGNDKEYAQMMERLRFGIQSQEDIEKLLSRVILPNSPIAKEALNIFGKNASVEEHNLQKLSDLPNALFQIQTKNIPPPGMEKYKTQVHIFTIYMHRLPAKSTGQVSYPRLQAKYPVSVCHPNLSSKSV